MKLIRKPKIAAAVAAVTDIPALALAALLNILRGRVPAQYSFDETDVVVNISHPYDLFGIFTALALVIAAVMSGLIIAAAVSGAKAKTAPRIAGAAALLVISAAVILFAHYIVCGLPVRNRTCFVFEDSQTGCSVAIQETQYSDGTGTVEVFLLSELAHDHGAFGTAEHEHYSVEPLTASELHEFSTDNTRYELEWGYSNDIVIRYKDKGSYRSFNIKLE